MCKRQWINCLGWGRESWFVCCCLPVVVWFLFGGFPLPLGAWDGLRYFVVALPEPSINYFTRQYHRAQLICVYVFYTEKRNATNFN